MQAIAVYCGSSDGNSHVFRELATRLGVALAERHLTLIYGGGKVGLMGAVADAALAAGGTARGFIPQSLMEKEVGHQGLTELTVVGSMHERKAAMEVAADGFVVLPGGFGTLDEFCEIVTWSLLGIHRKPIGLLDANGYYAPLLAFFDRAVEAGFIRPEHRDLILVDDVPAALLDRMAAWHSTIVPKWSKPVPIR
jgi:uncharacterized protein (TIGR00730 family)